MADINKLKDKIKRTIYPNGKGLINAADHQALLLDMADSIAEKGDGGGESASSPITYGDTQYSAILVGEYEGYQNRAISDTSNAIGAGGNAGLKGWYFNHINIADKKIFLTASQPTRLHITSAAHPDNTYTNTSFESGYSIGDKISLVYKDVKYIDYAKITAVSGNVITLDKIPFVSSEFNSSGDEIDYSIIVVDPFKYSLFGTNQSKNLLGITIVDKFDEGSVDFGYGAHAEGVLTYAINAGAHSEGYQTIAKGQFSHTEGFKTIAHHAAHAEGAETIASGAQSHAEGNTTQATGSNAHAEGADTIASGNNAHAEGKTNVASGNNAHAEGLSTIASGAKAHAEGELTKSIGNCSHTEGKGTIANNLAEHAEGKYNKSNSNTIHSVGIGTEGARKNAHEITDDGKHYILGVGGYDGTNPGKATDVATELTKIAEAIGNVINRDY